MNATIKHIAPWLAAAGIAGVIAIAPIAIAATDPCVLYGTDPTSPCIFGYHPANTPQMDVPF